MKPFFLLLLLLPALVHSQILTVQWFTDDKCIQTLEYNGDDSNTGLRNDPWHVPLTNQCFYCPESNQGYYYEQDKVGAIRYCTHRPWSSATDSPCDEPVSGCSDYFRGGACVKFCGPHWGRLDTISNRGVTIVTMRAKNALDDLGCREPARTAWNTYYFHLRESFDCSSSSQCAKGGMRLEAGDIFWFPGNATTQCAGGSCLDWGKPVEYPGLGRCIENMKRGAPSFVHRSTAGAAMPVMGYVGNDAREVLKIVQHAVASGAASGHAVLPFFFCLLLLLLLLP